MGFGGEWLERHPEEEGVELIRYASSKGINILDCWMADPEIQGCDRKRDQRKPQQVVYPGAYRIYLEDGQYFRTRDMK